MKIARSLAMAAACAVAACGGADPNSPADAGLADVAAAREAAPALAEAAPPEPDAGDATEVGEPPDSESPQKGGGGDPTPEPSPPAIEAGPVGDESEAAPPHVAACSGVLGSSGSAWSCAACYHSTGDCSQCLGCTGVAATYTCTGTPTPCDAIEPASETNCQQGGSLLVGFGACSPGAVCSSVCTYYEAADICTGTLPSCASVCQPGCTTTSTSATCTGTPTPCAARATEAACTSGEDDGEIGLDGCVWQ